MEAEVVTRKDLTVIYQCSYGHARKVYQEILLLIPEKERKKFGRRLPKHLVNKHLNK